MYGHATLITRSLFEKARPFRKEMPHDGWLAYHATLYGGVKYLPEVLVKYRQHAGNVFGVVGRKRKKKDPVSRGRKKRKELARVRVRMKAYYEACPDNLVPQKEIVEGPAGKLPEFFPLEQYTKGPALFRQLPAPAGGKKIFHVKKPSLLF